MLGRLACCGGVRFLLGAHGLGCCGMLRWVASGLLAAPVTLSSRLHRGHAQHASCPHCELHRMNPRWFCRLRLRFWSRLLTHLVGYLAPEVNQKTEKMAPSAPAPPPPAPRPPHRPLSSRCTAACRTTLARRPLARRAAHRHRHQRRGQRVQGPGWPNPELGTSSTCSSRACATRRTPPTRSRASAPRRSSCCWPSSTRASARSTRAS